MFLRANIPHIFMQSSHRLVIPNMLVSFVFFVFLGFNKTCLCNENKNYEFADVFLGDQLMRCRIGQHKNYENIETEC